MIVDPPSFAPNKAAAAKAQASYERLFELAARVTARWVGVVGDVGYVGGGDAESDDGLTLCVSSAGPW